MSPNRIGSDLRCLYAIGALDDYELLKKQVNESNNILVAVEAVLRERMCTFKGASPSQVCVCRCCIGCGVGETCLKKIHFEDGPISS